MITPQDHGMEFLWHASQPEHRRKHHEHRMPGNTGRPHERHDTGYDGEEEDPDQDGFGNAGDQFARGEDNEDMFSDKGQQYSDDAGDRGDKLDPNDLCPDHEAEPGQEGMEDSENGHQVSPSVC